jgi:DNA polymerase-4
MLGRAAGRHLHALANLHDSRPVRLRPRRRSIGSQHAWGSSRRGSAEIDADLVALVERVMRRVRAAKRVGRTVILRFRFDDFTRATRSHTLPHPTARTRVVLEAARVLLEAARPLIRARGLTMVGIALTHLADDLPFQLELPFDADDGVLLDAALDEIRDLYGTRAVTRAVLLGRRELAVPLLPD